MKSLFIIAGEASGDQLGGGLLQALKMRRPSLHISGIGGADMQAQGLISLFPMQELALMGFAEIVPHILRLKRRIRQTVRAIEAANPDCLLTIDSPGFTFRVVQMLRKRGKVRPKLVHYVAPTVWAYKPERAIKTANLFDKLLVILPFEPPYFSKHGLHTKFVGHHIAWWWREKASKTEFRQARGIEVDTKMLALFPGSRAGEIKKMMPLFRASCALLKQEISDLQCVIAVREEMYDLLKNYSATWPCPLHISINRDEKKALFAAADAGLAKSGTIGLECSLAELPSVTMYRAHPISIWYIRKKVKIAFVNLANILCREMVIPELIQDAATPENMAAALLPLLTDKRAGQQQLRKLSIIPAMLGANETTSPSDKAASAILALFADF